MSRRKTRNFPKTWREMMDLLPLPTHADVGRMVFRMTTGLDPQIPRSADPPPSGTLGEYKPSGAPAELPDLVTLDRAAAAGPAATPGGGNEAQPPIDFDALVNTLLEQGKPTQAALVRFMADRENATADEVGDKVHGNPEANDKAIGKNARETTDSLAGIRSRLSFRFVSGTMFRKIADE